VGERSLLDRIAVEPGQGGQPPGHGGATSAGLLQLAHVGLDVSAVHTQQPDAGPGAPGPEVAQVGLVGGARAVTVAEEELSDQALVGLPIHQHVRRRGGRSGFSVAATGSSAWPSRSADPVVGMRSLPLASFRLAHNRHYALYAQDGGEASIRELTGLTGGIVPSARYGHSLASYRERCRPAARDAWVKVVRSNAMQESGVRRPGRRQVVHGGWLGAGRVVGLGATLVVVGTPVVDVGPGDYWRGSSALRLRTATSPAATRATSPRENHARTASGDSGWPGQARRGAVG
jgi:hypothetical protein